jgi:hypothetical protein
VKKTRVSDLFRNNFRFYNNNNSVDLVREWTIPATQPPLVGKVNANFCG